jgi:ATP-binding cassette subfamily C exporter for protease/lipase
MTNETGDRNGPVAVAVAACRPMLVWAAAFSGIVNLLYLVPTLYMLQVYDRYVPSGNGATLLLVSLMGGIGLATLAALDWVRGRLLVRVSARFDAVLAGPTLAAMLAGSRAAHSDRAEAMRDFDTLRQMIASGATIALFDAPWAPIFLLFAFLLHPLLGLVTLVGATVLVALAWGNERATHPVIAAANAAAAQAYARQTHVSAHAAEVRALGMAPGLTAIALAERDAVSQAQIEASFAAGRYAALIKFFRLVFQSGALAVGAWLAVTGWISMGAIIAASLLLSRTLAPIEQLVAAWRPIVRAVEARKRLEALLGRETPGAVTMLPEPSGRIVIEALTIVSGPARAPILAGISATIEPGAMIAVAGLSGAGPLTIVSGPARAPILAGISATIEPGAMIAVAGLSGAGKSTLLRALAGAVEPAAGAIRLDGVALRDWDAGQRASHIGFLPQEFALLPGTVKENISRFAGAAGGDAATIDAAVMRAAAAIGAHEMIGRLPQGYDTRVGISGTALSAGQAQRIAIARALFGSPRILILDEPNAHLDAGAHAALIETLRMLRKEGRTIVVAAHGAELIQMADKLLVLADGRLVRFGDGPARSQARPDGAALSISSATTDRRAA